MTTNFVVVGHGNLLRADRQRLWMCDVDVTVSVRVVHYNRSLSSLSEVPKMLP
jgi:hypothetical protein